MSEHVLEWLPAYHDGELSPGRRPQVEEHLRDCPSCRAELHTLAGLAALLKADPAPEYTPPERFAAQVQLRLPQDRASRLSQNAQRLPRWVLGTPLTVITVWAFLQAGLWVTAFLLAAGRVVGPATACPAYFCGVAGWPVTGNALGVFGTLSVLNIALLVCAVILWAAWMAFWWAWQQNQDIQITSQRFEKEY